MRFREVSEIPGMKLHKRTKRNISKNEKRLIVFYNENIAIAKIIDWETEWISAESMYVSLSKSLQRFDYLPVDVIIRNNEVYLIRTDMV